MHCDLEPSCDRRHAKAGGCPALIQTLARNSGALSEAGAAVQGELVQGCTKKRAAQAQAARGHSNSQPPLFIVRACFFYHPVKLWVWGEYPAPEKSITPWCRAGPFRFSE